MLQGNMRLQGCETVTHICQFAEQVELMFKEHDVLLGVRQIVRLLNTVTDENRQDRWKISHCLSNKN